MPTRIYLLRRHSVAVLLAAAASLLFTQSSHAQQKTGSKAGAAVPKENDPGQKASGVIVKVDRVTQGATKGSTIERRATEGKQVAASIRLTINTNAVWRDWARDQVRTRDEGSPARDARRGNESVATKGEPQEANSLVVIDVGPDTRIETRFRSPDDETSTGTASTGATRGATPAKTSEKTSRESARPVVFRREDLKPGLFVEVDFKHIPAQNPALRIEVIRPVHSGAPASQPSEKSR